MVWGRTRKLRAMEVVMGLLCEAIDFYLRSAMVWNTIANARRMMSKDPRILKQAKQMCRIRECRNNQATMKEGARPSRRLNQKTSEEEVRRRNLAQPGTATPKSTTPKVRASRPEAKIKKRRVEQTLQKHRLRDPTPKQMAKVRPCRWTKITLHQSTTPMLLVPTAGTEFGKSSVKVPF